jgi:peptidyl-prolyl cis-trans isomerase SurA
MRLACSSLALIAALSAATPIVQAQGLAPQTLDSVVALVEDDVILRSELDTAITNIRKQYEGRADQLPPPNVLERQVLERLIMNRLLLERAATSNTKVSDEEVDQAVAGVAQQNKMSPAQLRDSLQREGIGFNAFRDQVRDELIIQRLRQRIVQSRVEVSDTEVEVLLASNSLNTGEVHLGHLLVAVPENATPEQIETARGKADGVSKLISEGMEFNAAAIRYSDGPQALDGGDLGWRPIDQVPTFFAEQIQAMNPGDITQPIRSPAGFHIIKVHDRRDNKQQLIEQYSARHILIKPSELLSSSEALAQIRDLRGKILAGGDFAKLAKQHSQDDVTKQAGGDLGWFAPTQYGPELAMQLVALKDDQISEPFQTSTGWHIVQRLGTRTIDKTEDYIRQQARENIRQRKAEEELETFMRQVRSEAFVETRLAAS